MNTETEISITDLVSKTFVETNMSKTVKKVDEDGDVSLYCYNVCSATDDDITKASRGLVYNGDDLLVKAYSYTDDYDVDENESEIIEILTKQNLQSCRIFDSHEGTLIRVFYAQNKWYISTHKKLDAYKSRWSSSLSYGEMFEQALEEQYRTNSRLTKSVDKVEVVENETVLQRWLKTLDTALCYTFIILNNIDNRIVCDAPTVPTMYFTGTFENSNVNALPVMSNSFPIPTPREKHFNGNETGLLEYVRSIDYKQLQGVIVFTPTGQYKIVNSDYKYFYEVRGNEASIKFRYLQVRMDREKREALGFLYPKMHSVFDEYENIIYKIAKHLKNTYINRYANKVVTSVPQSDYKIIKQCHQWHCEDRENNKISINYVIDLLNSMKPPVLNKMIRDFQQAEQPTSNEPATAS